MPEIDSLTIKGFKSVASVADLGLGAINVLIGANGSGKSNFLDVFRFLHEIREGRLREYVSKAGGADKVLHLGSKVTDSITVCISFGDGVHKYEIGLAATDADQLYLTREVYEPRKDYAKKSNTASRGTTLGEPWISESSPPEIAEYVRERLAHWRVHHFVDSSPSSPIKRTADINDNRYLRADGSNLAPFLYYLRQRESGSYAMIRRTVQQVAPFFDDFLLEPQGLNPDKIRLEWHHIGSDAYFDASSLSDGTLRFIALTTLFLQPAAYRPSIILVDEPELGLHPYAITMLASLVKQASVTSQVILSTQSPIFLDHFTPEDVLVADRKHGGTHLMRLESSRLAIWLEDYSLGQLWERNEIGGRPALEYSNK